MKWLVIAMLLTSCYQLPIDSHMQTMPLHDTGVRAGCIRTLARLAIKSQTAQVWSPDDAAAFCDEVERSYYEELRQKEWRQT